MITKCANPACGASFRYLRGGKLFLVREPPSSIDQPQGLLPRTQSSKEAYSAHEYCWLCAQCAQRLTITSDGNGRVFIRSTADRY